jgi:hypothetical protein
MPQPGSQRQSADSMLPTILNIIAQGRINFSGSISVRGAAGTNGATAQSQASRDPAMRVPAAAPATLSPGLEVTAAMAAPAAAEIAVIDDNRQWADARWPVPSGARAIAFALRS